MKFKYLIIPILAFIVGTALSYVFFHQPEAIKKDTKASFLKGGNFSLSNNGSEFHLSDLKGKAVILYFGYTFCPDVCPVGLAVIRDTFNSNSQFDETATAIFVTLDPERDTAEKMHEYTSFFHPRIKGLTGDLTEIGQVADQYGTFFRKSPANKKDGSYTVSHTAHFYLIDAEGELMRVLDHDTKANVLADELLNLL